MSALRAFASRLRGLFGKPALDAELDEELQAHLELLTEEHVRRGLPLEEARLAARRDFGGSEQVKEDVPRPAQPALRGGSAPGRPLRPAGAREEPGLYRGGGADPRPGHWRQHGNLLARERRAGGLASGSRSGPAGGDRSGERRLRDELFVLLSDVRGPAGPRHGVFRRRGFRGRPGQPQPCRVERAGRGRAGDGELLRDPGRAALARPAADARGRPDAGRTPGRGPEPRLLAAAVRRRACDRGTSGRAEREADDGRRRFAARLLRHAARPRHRRAGPDDDGGGLPAVSRKPAAEPAPPVDDADGAAEAGRLPGGSRGVRSCALPPLARDGAAPAGRQRLRQATVSRPAPPAAPRAGTDSDSCVARSPGRCCCSRASLRSCC